MGRFDKSCVELPTCMRCPFKETRIMCEYAKDHCEVDFKQILEDFKKEVEKVQEQHNGQ